MKRLARESSGNVGQKHDCGTVTNSVLGRRPLQSSGTGKKVSSMDSDYERERPAASDQRDTAVTARHLRTVSENSVARLRTRPVAAPFASRSLLSHSNRTFLSNHKHRVTKSSAHQQI